MSKTPPRNPRLPPQQEALPRYLDALLRETWEEPEGRFLPVDLIPAGESGPTGDPASPDPVMPATPPVTATPRTPEAGPRDAGSTAPFEAQLFQVAGLTLALPVAELVGIVDTSELVSAAAGDAPWLRGRLCYPHGEIQVADTAHWVLPPGTARSPAMSRSPVLVIADGRWGLACDAIGAVVTLDPAGIRWRSARTQRRWLAGMVSQPSCALLDATQLAALFTETQAAGTRP